MEQKGLDVELSADVAQGNYSNLAIISHSSSEFILDFATVLPRCGKGSGQEPHHSHAGTCQTVVAVVAGEYRAV